MTLKEKEQGGITILELSGKIMGGPDATLLNEKLHKLLDDEAIRIVENSAYWEPAFDHFIPIRVAFTFPINFFLL